MSDEKPDPALGFMEMFEALAPMFASAKGMKATLEADGWSPTVAEDVAREFMVGCIRMSFGGRR